MPKNPSNIPSGKCDNDPAKQEKLEAFKELAKKKLIKYWEGPENLGSVVSRSMVKLIKQFPAEGWVKSSSAIDEQSLKEISRLQRENDELRGRLEAIAREAPQGSEKLAQGDDEVELSFDFYATHKKTGEGYTCTSSLFFTWNDLFSCIAPEMIYECSEFDIERAVTGLVASYKDIVLDKPKFSGLTKAAGFVLNREDFNQIIVQFRALGLICLSTKKKNRSARDTSTYWSLTPYGDFIMTQLLAIKK